MSRPSHHFVIVSFVEVSLVGLVPVNYSAKSTPDSRKASDFNTLQPSANNVSAMSSDRATTSSKMHEIPMPMQLELPPQLALPPKELFMCLKAEEPYRGRTLEKIPHSSTYSRNSSASSARSMIDERMGWANEERSRSASRPAPEPASPFTEASPYHPHRGTSQLPAWDAYAWVMGSYTCYEPDCTAGPFQTQYLLK